MTFATLRRLWYVVLILNRVDMEALQRYVIGNRINASRALFAISEYSCNILHQNSISEEELNLVFAFVFSLQRITELIQKTKDVCK